MPTLAELNRLSSSQNFLIMLRTLNTSDLSFTYMLLGHRSLNDIIKNAENCLRLEIIDSCHHMTEEELDEFQNYISEIRTYVQTCEEMERA